MNVITIILFVGVALFATLQLKNLIVDIKRSKVEKKEKEKSNQNVEKDS